MCCASSTLDPVLPVPQYGGCLRVRRVYCWLLGCSECVPCRVVSLYAQGSSLMELRFSSDTEAWAVGAGIDNAKLTMTAVSVPRCRHPSRCSSLHSLRSGSSIRWMLATRGRWRRRLTAGTRRASTWLTPRTRSPPCWTCSHSRLVSSPTRKSGLRNSRVTRVPAPLTARVSTIDNRHDTDWAAVVTCAELMREGYLLNKHGIVMQGKPKTCNLLGCMVWRSVCLCS